MSVKLRSLTAAPPLSWATLWDGSEMTRERTVVSVALRGGGSRLPTLCFARLKSIPTPATLRFLLPGPAIVPPALGSPGTGSRGKPSLTWLVKPAQQEELSERAEVLRTAAGGAQAGMDALLRPQQLMPACLYALPLMSTGRVPARASCLLPPDAYSTVCAAAPCVLARPRMDGPPPLAPLTLHQAKEAEPLSEARATREATALAGARSSIFKFLLECSTHTVHANLPTDAARLPAGAAPRFY